MNTANPTDDPDADGEAFRWAWTVVAVVLLGLVGMGLVGVHQWYLKATVRLAVDVPTEGEMTDDQAELRQGIEALLMAATSGAVIINSTEPAHQDEFHARLTAAGYRWVSVSARIPPGPTPPRLQTLRQLALNVLVGDPKTLGESLADFLLDAGHEYATAVLERGKALGREEERKRCLAVVDKEEALCQYDTPPFTALAEVRDMITTGFAPPVPRSVAPPDPPPELR